MNLFKKTLIVFTLALTVLIGSTSAMETNNKVREMANETYVNRLTDEEERVKTSDKHQFGSDDESSFIEIILDIIGL